MSGANCTMLGGAFVAFSDVFVRGILPAQFARAVAVMALRATARLSGDSHWESLADRTVELIADAFTPETMALAKHGRRVAGAGSQLGWLLWADALPPFFSAAHLAAIGLPEPSSQFHPVWCAMPERLERANLYRYRAEQLGDCVGLGQH